MFTVEFTGGSFAPSNRIKRLTTEVILRASEILEISTYNTRITVAFVKGNRVAGAVNLASLDPIELQLAPQLPGDLVPTICHEMFHIRDLLTGRISVVNNEQHYNGRPVPSADIRLAHRLSNPEFSKVLLPDEAVAYAGMVPLACAVSAILPADVQTHLLSSFDDGKLLDAAKLAVKKTNSNLDQLLKQGAELLKSGKATAIDEALLGCLRQLASEGED